jgi:hypothetical protein
VPALSCSPSCLGMPPDREGRRDAICSTIQLEVFFEQAYRDSGNILHDDHRALVCESMFIAQAASSVPESPVLQLSPKYQPSSALTIRETVSSLFAQSASNRFERIGDELKGVRLQNAIGVSPSASILSTLPPTRSHISQHPRPRAEACSFSQTLTLRESSRSLSNWFRFSRIVQTVDLMSY